MNKYRVTFSATFGKRSRGFGIEILDGKVDMKASFESATDSEAVAKVKQYLLPDPNDAEQYTVGVERVEGATLTAIYSRSS